MVINCFFEECDDFVDIIYIPDLMMDIVNIQQKFFDWLFDKNIEHGCWVIVDSEKKYCKYGTQEFIDWINSYLLNNSCEKSYIVKKNASEWDKNNKSIVF